MKRADEAVNTFHKHIHKLNVHFATMVNKDSARSVFDNMRQGDLSMAKYYVVLKKQAAKCQYANQDDSIRTHILQTMKDTKLRREAMLKS